MGAPAESVEHSTSLVEPACCRAFVGNVGTCVSMKHMTAHDLYYIDCFVREIF